MRRSREYQEAIDIAKANLADLDERGDEAIGGDLIAYLDSISTPEEIARRKAGSAKISARNKARARRREKIRAILTFGRRKRART